MNAYRTPDIRKRRTALTPTLVSLASLTLGGCASDEERARALLSKAEAECGIGAGSFYILGVKNMYKDSSRKETQKVIAARFPRLGEVKNSCVLNVIRSGGFDGLYKLETY